MANSITWIKIEAYYDCVSDQGNVIEGTYASGPNKGETYDAVVVASLGAWISKYTRKDYRQGIAKRFIERQEKEIIRVATKMMKKDPLMKEFSIGKLRRVGIQETGIQSSRSASGVKYYPAGYSPEIILLFEGTFRSQPMKYSTSTGARPSAEVL